MSLVTVIVPYYNQPEMLRFQLANWLAYDQPTLDKFEFIVVDDGSAIRPLQAIQGDNYLRENIRELPLRIFRIDEDIPWNRGEARNIGWKEARTAWIFQMDADHVLEPPAATELVDWFTALDRPSPDPRDWYRFRRFRVGAADHTRNKDDLPRDAKYGEIKPHIDSYLCTRARYEAAGGYNLAFSGCLGGGTPFLHQMQDLGPASLAPPEISLNVLTTDVCVDASAALDRNTSEYKRRRAQLEKAGKIKGSCEIRHKYLQVL